MAGRLTGEHGHENAAPAVLCRGVARQPGGEVVARLNQIRADRALLLQKRAFCSCRVERRVRRPPASIVRDRSELGKRLGEAVDDDDRGEVDLRHPGLLVLAVDNAGDVRRVVSTPALRGEMEGRLRVFGELGDEEGEECMNVCGEISERVDGGAVGGV